MKFAAFIMTYERSTIILDTIQKLFDQTLPPQKILVVDNSESVETAHVIAQYNDPRIEYFRVGYNAGPAGAAKIGLQRLSGEGYDWIYWGDDNDPPSNKDVLRNLLELAGTLDNVGAIGGLGGFLNRFTGRTRNLMNRELGGICEVDFIPGGKSLIVNADVVKKNVLPSDDLFFGFEELDFCLKVKKAGFKIYIDGKAWLESRVRAGNTGDDYKWRGQSFNKKISARHYYSARNMLFVLSKNRLYCAMVYTFLKTFGKSLLAFRYGLKHGLQSFAVYNTALLHFIISRKGKQVIEF